MGNVIDKLSIKPRKKRGGAGKRISMAVHGAAHALGQHMHLPHLPGAKGRANRSARRRRKKERKENPLAHVGHMYAAKDKLKSGKGKGGSKKKKNIY